MPKIAKSYISQANLPARLGTPSIQGQYMKDAPMQQPVTAGSPTMLNAPVQTGTTQGEIVAKGVANIAVAMQNRAVTLAKQENSRLADQANIDYQGEVISALYDPEQGIMHRSGSASSSITADSQQAITTIEKKYAESLPVAAREEFLSKSRPQANRWYQTAAITEMSATSKYDQDLKVKKEENIHREIGLNLTNPKEVNALIEQGKEIFQTEKEKINFVDTARYNQIASAINREGVNAGWAVFNAVSDDFTEATRNQVIDRLEAETKSEQVERNRLAKQKEDVEERLTNEKTNDILFRLFDNDVDSTVSVNDIQAANFPDPKLNQKLLQLMEDKNEGRDLRTSVPGAFNSVVEQVLADNSDLTKLDVLDLVNKTLTAEDAATIGKLWEENKKPEFAAAQANYKDLRRYAQKSILGVDIDAEGLGDMSADGYAQMLISSMMNGGGSADPEKLKRWNAFNMELNNRYFQAKTPAEKMAVIGEVSQMVPGFQPTAEEELKRLAGQGVTNDPENHPNSINTPEMDQQFTPAQEQQAQTEYIKSVHPHAYQDQIGRWYYDDPETGKTFLISVSKD